MPGLYLEDEAFYDEEYENAFENAYDSDEVSYEQGDNSADYTDGGDKESGDSEETGVTEEEYGDVEWTDDENPDVDDSMEYSEDEERIHFRRYRSIKQIRIQAAANDI